MANDVTTITRPTGKLAYASTKTARLVPGRRSFFEYRDLGVTDATGGKMRAQVTVAKTGMTEPTGWHYHVCDHQFVYVLKGFVDLEFEEGQTLHCTPGDSVFIPGGLKHNEIRTSDDLEILEISLPAELGTVPCEPPAGG
jgi:quercetin dioxygenase-like cupin family protein